MVVPSSPPQGGRACSLCRRGATPASSISRSQSKTSSRLSLAAPALGKAPSSSSSSSSSSIAPATTTPANPTSRRGPSSYLLLAAASPSSSPSPPSPSTTPEGPSCPNWHPLSTPEAWSGSEAEALDGPSSSPAAFAALPPSWRVLLLSDGSVTRHLQILTGRPVAVDLLEMGPIAGSSNGGGEDGDEDEEGQKRNFSSFGLPSGAELLEGPLVQRRVLLRADEGRGEALVYAASWWNAGDAAAALDGSRPSSSSDPSSSSSSSSSSSARQQREQPIWTSLASSRTELFREIRTVYLGGCPALEKDLGAQPGEELWGRHYLFWNGGKPLTVIYEVFSPRLREWLG